MLSAEACYDDSIIERLAMGDFFVRGLAFLFLGAALTVILPALAQLLFTLGPIGFVIALFAFFSVGARFA